MVPPQFTAKARPHPVPTDRKRNIGRTRLHLLKRFSGAAQKGIQRGPSYCLAPNGSSLEEEWGAHTSFRHRVYLFSNFTTFSRQSQREEATTIVKKQQPFLCTLTGHLFTGGGVRGYKAGLYAKKDPQPKG